MESGIWGLQVLPAGTQLENPSELFGSPGMQPVLDQIQLLADVVLLDTPPVLAVPDTAILGSMARGAVIVASEGRTDRTDLERTVRRLENTHCRVLGHRHQPGQARLHRLIPVLRLQAMSRADRSSRRSAAARRGSKAGTLESGRRRR